MDTTGGDETRDCESLKPHLGLGESDEVGRRVLAVELREGGPTATSCFFPLALGCSPPRTEGPVCPRWVRVPDDPAGDTGARGPGRRGVGTQAEPWGSGPQGISFGLSWEWTNSGARDPEKPPW